MYLRRVRKTFDGDLEFTRSRGRYKCRRLLWAKKWLREGTIPTDKRTGRLLFEKEQTPPSRFVYQFLEDVDALQAASCVECR